MLKILRGLPGSGKTTLAKYIASDCHKLIFVFEADQYFEDEDGNYKFDITKLSDAHKWCQKITKEYLKLGFDVIVSNTFTQLWEMQPYIDICMEMQTRFEVIKVIGNYKNIHGVPEETVNRMKSRWEDYPGEFVLENINVE